MYLKDILLFIDWTSHGKWAAIISRNSAFTDFLLATEAWRHSRWLRFPVCIRHRWHERERIALIVSCMDWADSCKTNTSQDVFTEEDDFCVTGLGRMKTEELVRCSAGCMSRIFRVALEARLAGPHSPLFFSFLVCRTEPMYVAARSTAW